jgi:hypothetical protein
LVPDFCSQEGFVETGQDRTKAGFGTKDPQLVDKVKFILGVGVPKRVPFPKGIQGLLFREVSEISESGLSCNPFDQML